MTRTDLPGPGLTEEQWDRLKGLAISLTVDQANWVGGYFTTRGERLREMEHFYSIIDPKIPLIVLGDFNDTPKSRAVRFLEHKGSKNALPQFDRRTPTWHWRLRYLTLKRKMDHILYSREMDCISARVVLTGPSDHYPVEATLVRGASHSK